MEKLDNIEKLIVKNVNFSFGFKEILKDITQLSHIENRKFPI